MSSRRSRRRQQQQQYEEEYYEAAFEEDEDAREDPEEVTRCICGDQELVLPDNSGSEFDEVDVGFFIQCESCSVWQHGYCVGIKDDSNAPEKYWCEQCKPDNHQLFTDQFGYNRSRYDPNHVDTKRPKRRRAASTGARAIHSRTHSHSDSATPTKDDKTTKVKDEKDGDVRVKRTRHRDLEYELQLKKAIEESARESGVQPEEVQLSSSETSTRESRMLRKRAANTQKSNMFNTTTSVKDEDDEVREDQKDEIEETSQAEPAQESDSNNNSTIISNSSTNQQKTTPPTSAVSEKQLTPEPEKLSRKRSSVKEEEQQQQTTAAVGTSTVNATATEAEPETDAVEVTDSKTTANSSPVKLNKRGGRHPREKKEKKDKKEKQKAEKIEENKPFRPNLPHSRINLNEMRRRIFSIMEFISNIQIELSTQEDFKNNLLRFENNKREGEELTLQDKEISGLQQSLLNCYNDSVVQLDGLTKKLNEWEEKYH